MAFVKKMCVLKQMRSGYSQDGNPLSGIVKIEGGRGRIFTQVSLINFAPLTEGNYCLVLTSRKGEVFSCPLSHTGGRSEASDEIDLSMGFLAVVCYVDSREYAPIAFGVCGENVYEIGSLLYRLFTLKKDTQVKEVSYPKQEENPPIYNKVEDNSVKSDELNEEASEKSDEAGEVYDDEAIADENYYAFSSTGEKEDNLLSNSVLRAFKICGGDTYYQSVRSELDEIFNLNPRDESLLSVFPHSLWAQLSEGEEKGNLVGVIFEQLTVRYVCFAKKKKEGESAPKNSCFVPCSFFEGETDGYFVTFRDADTGAYATLGKEEES